MSIILTAIAHSLECSYPVNPSNPNIQVLLSPVYFQENFNQQLNIRTNCGYNSFTLNSANQNQILQVPNCPSLQYVQMNINSSPSTACNYMNTIVSQVQVVAASDGEMLTADCAALGNIARTLNAPQAMVTAVSQNCCNQYQVTCASGTRVTGINWSNMGLGGSLPSNAFSTLTALYDLFLANNQISGNLPALPQTLLNLDISHNQFSGSFPGIPLGIIKIIANNNQLSGSFPSLPDSLLDFNIRQNFISGNLPIYFPSHLRTFYITSNYISGSFPNSPPSTLLDIDVGYNQLSGSVSIPYNGLQMFLINDNQFSQVIISSIASLNGGCSLARNPPLSRNSVANYYMCDMTGLN